MYCIETYDHVDVILLTEPAVHLPLKMKFHSENG